MILTGKHFLKHKLSENLKNIYFVLVAYIKYLFKIPGSVSAPPGYKLVFEDNFKNLNNWRLGQPWGDFHPDYLNQYYDTTGEMAYVDRGNLVLEIKNKPKKYIKSQLDEWRRVDQLPEEFTIPVGVGHITSLEDWQWGWFEAWIKIPKGKNYWLAYWMSGTNSWPPEIDIFEAYSRNGENYNSNLLKLKNFKIQPNLHFGDLKLNNKDSWGAYDVPIHDVTERFVQYVCHWEKDFIKIYYDGNLIFETRDQRVLEWYNGKADKMFIILGHGHEGFNLPVTESKMFVKSLRVFQK